MLKNFLYLNEQSVDSYLSSLEDGLRESAEERVIQTKRLAALEGVHDGRDSNQEHRRSRVDTPASRFSRLRSLALSDVENTGWIAIEDVATDFSKVKNGSLVELECELYVPEVFKALAPKGGLLEALDFIDRLSPQAEVLGLPMDGLPSRQQSDAMKSMSGLLGSDVVFVGELDDSTWRIAGRLLDSFVSGEVEGLARVVGKVTTTLGEGQWKPLMSLPGMNLLPREKRRQMERTSPSEDEKQNYLEGPAFMLDVLAIYR